MNRFIKSKIMKNRRLVLCMSVKTGIACLLVSIYTSCSVKTDSAFPAPVAPMGTEHWTYNEEISDEFEGTSLDTAKWLIIIQLGSDDSLHSSAGRMYGWKTVS